MSAGPDAIPFAPLPTSDLVRTDTYHQLKVHCIESLTSARHSKRESVRTSYGGDTACARMLVMKSSASVFDLLKATLCAFGLESGETSEKQYAKKSNGGKLNLLYGACKINDVRIDFDGETHTHHMSDGMQIPGLTYRTKDTGSYLKGMNPLGELKTVKIAQILDRPLTTTGAERSGGLRQDIKIEIITPERVAFASKHTAGLPTAMDLAQYAFVVSLEAIGTKQDLQSTFQTLLGTRCVGATGGVLGGNRINYVEGSGKLDTKTGETEIDELNLRFAAGKKIVGLICGSGDPEEDFSRVSRWMSKRLFDL